MGGAVIVLNARDQEVQKMDDDILGTLASSIVPREDVDKMLIGSPLRNSRTII